MFKALLDTTLSAISRKTAHHPAVAKIAGNTGWLFGDKVLRLAIGLPVSVMLARYLGPEQFGILNFAMAFVAPFAAVAVLGLPGLAVRNIVQDPSNATEILGTSLTLQVLSSVVCMAAALGTAAYLNYEDVLAKTVISVLGLGILARAGEAPKYWFDARVQSKYVVWAQNAAFLSMAAVRVVLMLVNAPLVAFAWAMVLETLLASFGLIGAYVWCGGKLRAWKPTLNCALDLLRSCWPLVLSDIAIMIQARIDQVMLGTMIGNAEVGQYSAAMRIIEAVAFLPVIISASLAPYVYKAKAQNEAVYQGRLLNLYRIMFIAFVVVALPVALFGNYVVLLLLGPEYAHAGTLLSLFSIRLFFANYGVAKGVFITGEGLFKYSLIAAILGSAINIGLNYILIPYYQSEGAFFATVISFGTTIFILDAFFVRTRANLGLMLRSIITPHKISLQGR